MTLGNRITTLRNTHHMSQGDLAERLNVSRQSVSKWETDTSVPDLDKLIALSDLFQVTLDELIRGPLQLQDSAIAKETPPTISDLSTPHQTKQDPTTMQNKVGAIFMIASLLLTLLGILGVGDDVFILVALLLFICGTICLLAKRYAVIWVTWAIGIPLMFIGSAAGGGAGLMVFFFIILITLRFYYAS